MAYGNAHQFTNFYGQVLDQVARFSRRDIKQHIYLVAHHLLLDHSHHSPNNVIRKIARAFVFAIMNHLAYFAIF